MSTWLAKDTVLLDDTCPLPLDQPFTRPAAQALGVSIQTLRTLERQGLVRRVGQGVYAAAQAPSTQEFRAAALRLVVAPSAVVTDRTAAWLHGIELLARSKQSLMPPLSIFDRPGYRARRPGVDSGERLLLERDVMEVAGVAVTTPLRTACDLGRLLWRFDALAALDQFLGLGVSLEELWTEIARFKGYRGVIQLRPLAAVADARAESVAESWLRLFWYDAGLPRPEAQWWVADDNGRPVFRLDLALPEAKFGAEYDGAEFHTDEDRAADEGRRAWLGGQRAWHIEVFDKSDLFVPRPDPIPRLQRGLVIARRRLALPTAYPTLRPNTN